MTDLSLAEAIATRLCHDLTGPVSACGNGIELLTTETDPKMQQQARELMLMSAREGITRLQFYRTAFGQLKDIKTVDTAETRDIARAFFTQGKIKLDWPEDAGFARDMPNALRQVLYGALLVMAGLLAYGGALTVRHAPGRLVLTGSHKRMKDDQEAIAVVNGGGLPDTPLTPYNVIPHFLYTAARKSGMALACNQHAGPEQVTVELTAEYR